MRGVDIRALQAAGYDYVPVEQPMVLSPWLRDRDFVSAYEKALAEVRAADTVAMKLYKDDRRANRYMLFKLAESALSRDGDLIECGVHHGITPHFLGYLLDAKCLSDKKQIWAVDSFEGVSEPVEADIHPVSGKHSWRKGSLSGVDLPHVKKILGSHQTRVNVVQGWIPDALASVTAERLCFAHIDVDLYQPTLDSLEFVYPRLSSGGVIVFDDYGYPNCPGAKQAIDEFYATHPGIVIALPTGQAFSIKP